MKGEGLGDEGTVCCRLSYNGSAQLFSSLALGYAFNNFKFDNVMLFDSIISSEVRKEGLHE
jgi:hypothetical protein